MAWAGVAGAGIAATSGALGMYVQHLENKKAWHRQKKVLQKQIQWRVEDAKKAGIHPLAALGVSPASGPEMAAMPSMPDIGGAAESAARTYEDVKLAELAREQEAVRTENLRLDGQIKAQQLKQMKSTGLIRPTGNALVDDLNNAGQVNTADQGAGNGVVVVPNEQQYQDPLGVRASLGPWVDPYLDELGYYVGGPSMEGAQKLQADLSVKIPYYLRRLVHAGKNTWAFARSLWNEKKTRDWYYGETSRMRKLPKGWHWTYHPLTFSWQAVKGELKPHNWFFHEGQDYKPGYKYGQPRERRSWQRLKRR